MPIRILSEKVANQIAAGEVIERPASVVKELIENSIDAGASEIKISLEQAGRSRIRIEDNGSGIPAEDLPLAVASHATSKLTVSEDLLDIKTLGFRGEALASIGSVSRLVLTSKTPDKAAGARITADGGHLEPVELASSPQGTTIEVADLFYNVPARLKFLKSDITETRQVLGLVSRYAMAYPHIRWTYKQDGKTFFKTTGNGSKKEILHTLFGSQDASNLLYIELTEPGLTIEGFISNLQLNRSNRKDITLFVNGRWVQDPALTAAVIKAYNTMLMVGRYPVAILFISMPSNQVDVNVHPSKAEVRFRNADQVFSGVQRAIRRGLLAYTPVPEINPVTLWGKPVYELPPSPRQPSPDWEMARQSGFEEKTESTPKVNESLQQAVLPGQNLPLLRLIGQVASTYLIAEGPDGLYLIDQHAAHERVLFDELMAAFKRADIPSQSLAVPETIDLSPEKAAVLATQLAVFSELGFDVEEFGPNTFLIRAIPALFKQGDPKAAVISVIQEFEEDETPLQAEIEAKIAGRVCKRMAVKAGHLLSQAEQQSLLEKLESSSSPRTCPHGRPTMIHLSAALLERQFGRTGPI
ncbi:MAG: DNA mismatch repair endonuclease MutL [Anaerolineaceae bacterium]|nr:DNA mismatch repair endonuclease MutL [Anaerolineaceae bacterium]